MALFNFRKKEERTATSVVPEYITTYGEALPFATIYNNYNSMNLSAVYRATELISDSVAVLPIYVRWRDSHQNVYGDNPITLLCKDLGGGKISKYNLIKLLIQSVILKGNGFAYIERGSDGTPKALRYLESKDVTIHYDKARNDLYYTCSTVSNRKIEPINIVHLLKNSYNGVEGVSILSYASRTLNLANSTENSANNFYSNGCNLSGVLTVEGQLSANQRNDIRNSWQQAYTNGGSGLAILQGNMKYQPVQLNAEDSQLLQSRQYNVTDIARFFGISPVLLGDLTHSSYSTLEAAQQEFLVHTLQPYISMVEEEFTRKLCATFTDYEINLDEAYLMRTDKAAQANYWQTLLNCGVLSINEVRHELGLTNVDGGDQHIIPYNSTAQSTIDGENKK